MTLFSLALTGRYSLSARVHLIGLVGGLIGAKAPRAGRPAGPEPAPRGRALYRFAAR